MYSISIRSMCNIACWVLKCQSDTLEATLKVGYYIICMTKLKLPCAESHHVTLLSFGLAPGHCHLTPPTLTSMLFCGFRWLLLQCSLVHLFPAADLNEVSTGTVLCYVSVLFPRTNKTLPEERESAQSWGILRLFCRCIGAGTDWGLILTRPSLPLFDRCLCFTSVGPCAESSTGISRWFILCVLVCCEDPATTCLWLACVEDSRCWPAPAKCLSQSADLKNEGGSAWVC